MRGVAIVRGRRRRRHVAMSGSTAVVAVQQVSMVRIDARRVLVPTVAVVVSSLVVQLLLTKLRQILVVVVVLNSIVVVECVLRVPVVHVRVTCV